MAAVLLLAAAGAWPVFRPQEKVAAVPAVAETAVPAAAAGRVQDGGGGVAAASEPVTVRGGETGEEDMPQSHPVDSAGARLTLLASDQPALRTIRLDDEDSGRYRRIFALQGEAAWDAADAEIARLHDRRLLGHVLRQRYLHPGFTKVGYDDLRSWLKRYGDQAGAERIHALAVARQPHGAPPPPDLPDAERLTGVLEDRAAGGDGAVAPRSRSGEHASDGAVLERIDGYVRDGKLGAALRVLGDDVLSRRLDSLDYDSLRARIAAGLFYNGSPRAALALAAASAARSGEAVPAAQWIAGLASWRLGDMAAAGRHFEAMASNPALPPADGAAAAYWAARVEARAGHADRAERWLDRAARYDRSFYGLIAERALGRSSPFQWQVPPLSARHLAAIADTAPGYRAIALLQVGQDDLAELELRRVHPRRNAVLAEALVALADQAGLPALALELGNAVASPEGGTYDAALYPLPHWSPPEGFALDRALLFAIMRQESRFEPRLISRAGATGVMQLMPETARDMSIRDVPEREAEAGDTIDASSVERQRLFNPQLNLGLGQRYVASLLTSPLVAGNLIHLAAAYNAGPATLARWRHELEEIDDPLLFVECIPIHETRDYVHKVLANLWIYQKRLGQPAPTLDAMATGGWPVYLPAPARTTQVAVREED